MATRINRPIAQPGQRANRWLAELHRDQQGSVSIASVFALILLVVLFGLILNSGRQVDQKVKMQNTADAAGHAGGVVLARSMNTLAFTNHLLSDVFALTAFFREGRDRHCEALTDGILANWERMAPALVGSEFPRFDTLGLAIQEKVGPEADMVFTFSEWNYAASELFLPVLEAILADEMIPQFQRALVETTPELVQVAAAEVAERHGQSWPAQATLHAVLWRTDPDPVGGGLEPSRRTLPVVDPVLDQVPDSGAYFANAIRQREQLAHRYLNEWNAESLEPFDRLAKMSQFSNLWRIFTCGQLKKLLEDEYPHTNLPFQIRRDEEDLSREEQLARDYMFVAVAYRSQLSDRMPGVFRNPVESSTTAYAQIMLFVPRNRLVKVHPTQQSDSGGGGTTGGIPGDSGPIPLPRVVAGGGDQGDVGDVPPWYIARQRHPVSWDLLTQHWTIQLVPATSSSIPQILSTQPGMGLPTYTLPDLSALSEDEFQWLSNH